MLYIFDWDGTLSNSLDRIAESMQGAFVDNDMVVPSVDQRKSVVGLGLREAFVNLVPSAEAHEIDRLTESYRDHYLRLDTQSPCLLYTSPSPRDS